jgi:hypothetical protein
MDIVVNTMVEAARELMPNISGFVGIAEEPVSEYYVAAAAASGSDPMNLNPDDGGFLGKFTLFSKSSLRI